MEFYFHFYCWNQFKVIPWPVHSVNETSQNSLRRPTRVDNMADNADITQSLAASHHRLLSHMTLADRFFVFIFFLIFSFLCHGLN